MDKKVLYIVLDGVGDRGIASYGGHTPLEQAETPNIDLLALNGKLGLLYPVGEGIAPESDLAVISLLGYDAEEFYTGRGPLECFAEGLKVKSGDLAYRVNFATIADDGSIIDRRVGRDLSSEEAKKLGEEINQKIKLSSYCADFWFKPTIGHRGVLLIRCYDGPLSHHVENTDPAYGKHGVFGIAKEKFENKIQRCVPEQGFENDQSAKRAAELTNEFIEKSRQVLKDAAINEARIKNGKLPANVILTRDAGDRLPEFPKLPDKYKRRFASLVEMPVEKGIALLTGMDIIAIPPPSKNYAQDYGLRVNKVLEAIRNYDVLYIHLKGPDEPGHDGNFELKKEIIELIDKHFFAPLVKSLSLEDFVIAVTGDHSTPCELKSHSADPVPLLVYGKGRDNTVSFGETEAAQGAIGKVLGKDVFNILLE